jgi:hypothetical protein
MSDNESGLVGVVESGKMPRRIWGLAAADVSNALLAIVLVLLFFGVANLFLALLSLVSQNFKGFFIYFVITIIYVVPAYGLLNLNKWARLFQLVSSLFMVITGFISIYGGNRLVGAISIILHGLIAMYLLTEKCQVLFKSQRISASEEQGT